LVVAVIGLATAALFGFLALLYVTESLSFALDGPMRPHLRAFSSTDAAFFLALAVGSLVGLVFLSRRRGERQSWIGAALIGVGPVLITGIGLKTAVGSTLAGSFRPEDWLVAVLAWGSAAAVCIAVAVGLRRLPTPTSATAGTSLFQ
jgi:hypothetical protein